MIDKYGLLVNNKPRCSTWPIIQETLVINLALSTAEFRLLTFLEISEEYPILLDHELILLH